MKESARHLEPVGDIARRLGFEGGLTWLKTHLNQPREMSLRQVVELIYGSLDRMEGDWKQAPFVAQCARLIADAPCAPA